MTDRPGMDYLRRNRHTLVILFLGAALITSCTMIWKSNDVHIDRSEKVEGTNRVTRIEIKP